MPCLLHLHGFLGDLRGGAVASTEAFVNIPQDGVLAKATPVLWALPKPSHAGELGPPELRPAFRARSHLQSGGVVQSVSMKPVELGARHSSVPSHSIMPLLELPSLASSTMSTGRNTAIRSMLISAM